jgi:sugar O-acyltransferase (sialic acid O-acetyltransferase NeuD family)
VNKLLIIGAGGHGVVVADAADTGGHWESIAFLDDAYPHRSRIEDWDIVGSTAALEVHASPDHRVVVAIGNAQVRMALLKKVILAGYKLATVVHQRAHVSRLAAVGGGSVLMANAVVNARAKVGIGSIVNTGATVDHDCLISRGVHIAPGAHLAADVRVGEQSWIGAGASVKEQIRIGNNVTVGAGAAVVNDIPDGSVVVGVPARPIESRAQLKAMGL